MTARTAMSRSTSAFAIGVGFFSCCTIEGVTRILVVRGFDPLLGEPLPVFGLFMVLSLIPSFVTMGGALVGQVLLPRVDRSNPVRVRIVCVVLGAATFGLALALNALRRLLDDSLIRPTLVEEIAVALLMPFLTAVLVTWVSVKWMLWKRWLQPASSSGECCAECGYDLRGRTGPRCPECGASSPLP